MSLEAMIQETFPFKITQGALDTANTYARLARLDDKTVEAYMHLVGDDVLTDVFLTKEQYVGTAFCQPTVKGLADTYAGLDGKKIAGWCHSHAEFSNFFSTLDKQNVLSFSDIGGIKKELDNEPISLFYNLVVNARNDIPFCALAYEYKGNYGLIEHIPLIVLPGGTALSEQTAKEHLSSALRHPCPESVPPFEFLHIAPDEKMLEKIIGEEPLKQVEQKIKRITYKEKIGEQRILYEDEPRLYSQRFGEVLDILEGKKSRQWIDRVADVLLYYMKEAPTQKEKEAVHNIVHSNSYLRKNPHIQRFLDIILEASYAARPTAAPLGNRKTA